MLKLPTTELIGAKYFFEKMRKMCFGLLADFRDLLD